MNRRNLYAGVACALLWLNGCKEPTISEGIVPLTEPTSVDADGGNWRTITLKSVADIAVPQPAAITSDVYQKEVSDIKNGLLGVNPEHNTAVNYWAVGGVSRWNQIARQLVAKYNVAPPYDNATGTFAPFDATAPSANPPFAARVYALLSVAQYDALVVAWKAKYQYNRPSLTRQGINGLIPVLDVPSYPSEDAAIAEVSAQILTFLFPKEADWIRARATEHKQSRIWAGVNVASDLKAGEDLAAAVATKVMTVAKADRFSAARDPNNTWKTTMASAPYDLKWTSLEIPARPPTLPLAGAVKTWYDSTAVFRTAPGPPPATTSPEFQKALAEVRSLADSRTREQWRIADFWSDGAGTYASPGHWNLIAEALIQENGQNELRAARTYALLNRAMQDGSTLNWYTKYNYYVPRPSQMDPAIKTATGIPNFPGYTADQATFSTAAATVLSYLFPTEATSLTKQADEAVLSGLYSGTHYRFDTEAGAKSGTAVGQLAVGWAKSDGAK